MQRKDGILSSRPDIGEPFEVDGGEEAANLRLEGLVSASGGKLHRRLGSRQEPGEFFKDHHSQSVGASDVVPFIRIAMPK